MSLLEWLQRISEKKMMPGIQQSVGFLADQYSAWENVSPSTRGHN